MWRWSALESNTYSTQTALFIINKQREDRSVDVALVGT